MINYILLKMLQIETLVPESHLMAEGYVKRIEHEGAKAI
jgi:hypothetical protein